ncbi:hypothetical protein GU90_02735 [Saccharopolyspora rectivirgula]|uniref:Uncharacterized protein n=1 Tax=Saccharopolyspora rectivirgula TaxID=28042 RepID=A0A073B2M2_9PSEU|nr:hypothetical protein GU90_02735 [Saccharopolyspora rectivirgula]
MPVQNAAAQPWRALVQHQSDVFDVAPRLNGSRCVQRGQRGVLPRRKGSRRAGGERCAGATDRRGNPIA